MEAKSSNLSCHNQSSYHGYLALVHWANKPMCEIVLDSKIESVMVCRPSVLCMKLLIGRKLLMWCEIRSLYI